MNRVETTKITQVDVLNVPKPTTFIHEGTLYVNSLMMPPVNSQPLNAGKIIIATDPGFNSINGTVLTIDYAAKPSTAPSTGISQSK